MAELVGGIGTPHSPMVGIDPGGWVHHGDLEQDRLQQLKATEGLVPASRSAVELAAELDPDLLVERHARLQAGLKQVAEALVAMRPDVLVVVGDDQRELFLDDAMPALAIYWGDELWDRPPGAGAYPSSMADAYCWYHADEPEPYPTDGRLGRYLVEQLIGAAVDVAQFREQPEGRSLGHAFTFIYRRLLGSRTIPLVPVMLNTYYPPNQPRPRRCIDIGRALGDALRRWDAPARIAVVASGGLSHPIVDERLDRAVLDAIVAHDHDALAQLPLELLIEGSSEIRNWLTVAGALDGVPAQILDYVPAYRSTAGSGCGMGFVVWRSA